MEKVRVVVIGTGQIGKNHCPGWSHETERAELTVVFDADAARAEEAAKQYGSRAVGSLAELAAGLADAAVVAAPTTATKKIGCRLMEAGIDVLVEKPIAPTLRSRAPIGRNRRSAPDASCRWDIWSASIPRSSRWSGVVTKPLFFEIHRLSEFSARAAWTWT